MRRAIIAATVLGIGSSGCHGGGEAPLPVTRLTDSAGIQVGTVSAEDGPPPWAPELICRLGGAETGPGAFSQVDQATVTTDGTARIHVLRPDHHTVEVFAAGCQHLASLGRLGDGPGELRAPTSITVTPEGEIQVFDAARQALVRWNNRFDVLPVLPWTRTTSLPNGPLRIQGDRAVFLAARGGDGTMTHVLAAVDGTGRVDLDSVVNPFPAPVLTRCGMVMLDPVFTPQPLWSPQGARTAFASTERYEVRLYDGRQLARIARRALPAAATQPGDAARAQPEGQRIGACTIPVEELATAPGVAATRPVIASLSLDDQGRLWVERWGFPDQPPVTDLFAADGLYLGTFRALAPPLGGLGNGRIVVPVRDPATGVGHLEVLASPTRP